LIKSLFGVRDEHSQIQYVRASPLFLVQRRDSLMGQPLHLMVKLDEILLAFPADLFKSVELLE
jgi:hypothetical protein